MKKILSDLAKRFRRFTTNSSDHTQSSVNIPPASIITISPSVSGVEGTRRAQPPTASQNAVKNSQAVQSRGLSNGNTFSFSPDFITRQELKRELDLVRRLIESRK
jgi:hypothetical protein